MSFKLLMARSSVISWKPDIAGWEERVKMKRAWYKTGEVEESAMERRGKRGKTNNEKARLNWR
jgi:hypothetical protein